MRNNYETLGKTSKIIMPWKDISVETLVDTEDLLRILGHPNPWRANRCKRTNKFYVTTRVQVNGVRKTITLAREILNYSGKLLVDHIDCDTLNNTKANLRVATNSENLQNRSKLVSNNTSGVRGLSKFNDKWVARVGIDNRQIRIGTFSDKKEAEKALIKARAKLMPFSKEARGCTY